MLRTRLAAIREGLGADLIDARTALLEALDAILAVPALAAIDPPPVLKPRSLGASRLTVEALAADARPAADHPTTTDHPNSRAAADGWCEIA